MKECKNKCRSWMTLSAGAIADRTERVWHPWTHCPYCDSGKLVDKEAELKDELKRYFDNNVGLKHSRAFIDSMVDGLFIKYEIKRKT